MRGRQQETSGQALQFLSGGGDTGHRFGTHDWDTTPLGRPETWPPRLQTAVAHLLAATSPIAICWGPDLLALHNDAYASMMGEAWRMDRVAVPFRDLSPELWQRVGPQVEAAMRHAESVVLENQLVCVYRSGRAEEVYLTLSCQPMGGDAGCASGVLITLVETTRHVLAGRRTIALREVAAAGTGALSFDDACRRTLDAISRQSIDIPFALLYVVRNRNERDVHLTATAGLAVGTLASPPLIAHDSGERASWPVPTALAASSTVVVDDLLTRFETLPAGDWPFAPRTAVVVPLTIPGRDRPDAALVAGISARHPLDTSYLDFIELIGKHVVAAMAGGLLREDDERRAVMQAAASRARAKRRARMTALKARFAGVLEERTRLAREIHDTLLQGVTGVALQLRAALPHVRTSSEAVSTLEQIAELAEQTSREARQAVWEIRPKVSGEREFVRTLESTARRTLGRAALVLRLSTRGRAPALGADVQEVVQRIVQEAVANVVRHADARTIRLTMSFAPRRLRLTVTDDGRGFSVDDDLRSYAGHWGLLGMRERAEQIGAALCVRSAPKQGTTVALEVPLATAGSGRRLALPRDAA